MAKLRARHVAPPGDRRRSLLEDPELSIYDARRFCYGALRVLYWRHGAGGATWQRWGWACDRCHSAWRKEPAPV